LTAGKLGTLDSADLVEPIVERLVLLLLDELVSQLLISFEHLFLHALLVLDCIFGEGK